MTQHDVSHFAGTLWTLLPLNLSTQLSNWAEAAMIFHYLSAVATGSWNEPVEALRTGQACGYLRAATTYVHAYRDLHGHSMRSRTTWPRE